MSEKKESNVHPGQIEIPVGDPGTMPPPPFEAYAAEFGYMAATKQKIAWQRQNDCQCDEGKGLHAIGCPQAKRSR